MSRYRSSVLSTTATINTPYLALGTGSTGDAQLRRLTIGFTSAGGVPNSQQVDFSVQHYTGGTTGTGITAYQLRPTSRPALVTPQTGYTLGTAAGVPWYISLNTQSAGDLPWEQLEEWFWPASSYLVIQNLVALPASCGVSISAEWEE
jgi:hypothetical protein